MAHPEGPTLPEDIPVQRKDKDNTPNKTHWKYLAILTARGVVCWLFTATKVLCQLVTKAFDM